MKKLLFLLASFPSMAHAVVIISSTSVKSISNPYLRTGYQYITSIDTNSVQAGNNITVVATSSGVSVASTGGGGGGSALSIDLTNSQLGTSISTINFTNEFTGTLAQSSVTIALTNNSSNYAQINPTTPPQTGPIFLTTGTVQNMNASSVTVTTQYLQNSVSTTSQTNVSTFSVTGALVDFSAVKVQVGTETVGQTVFVSTASVWQVGTSTIMAWTNAGHFEIHATTNPTLSSCGTGPVMTDNSSDTTGTFTMGSVTVGCTMTFSNIWKNIPSCFANDETGVNAVRVVPTRTNVVFTTAGTGGDTVDYFCVGEH